jgi:hypothetical protein
LDIEDRGRNCQYDSSYPGSERIPVRICGGTITKTPNTNGTSNRWTRSQEKAFIVRERSEYQIPMPEMTNSSGIPHIAAKAIAILGAAHDPHYGRVGRR